GESGIPLHISGVSPRSNGNEGLSGKSGERREEFIKLANSQGFPWHPDVPYVFMTMSAVNAECVCHVRDNLHAQKRLQLQPRKLVRAIVEELRSSRSEIPPSLWTAFVDELQNYCRKHDLSTWLQNEFPDLSRATPPVFTPPKKMEYGL